MLGRRQDRESRPISRRPEAGHWQAAAMAAQRGPWGDVFVSDNAGKTRGATWQRSVVPRLESSQLRHADDGAAGYERMVSDGASEVGVASRSDPIFLNSTTVVVFINRTRIERQMKYITPLQPSSDCPLLPKASK